MNGNNTFNAPPSDGSAAKHSITSTESNSLPKTPIPGIQNPVNVSASGESEPHVTPCAPERSHAFPLNHGYPAHVNPSIFANPYQGYNQPFPAYPPTWYQQTAPPAGPVFPPPGMSTPTNSTEKTANESFASDGPANSGAIVATTTLNHITDSSEFTTWLKNFTTFLTEQGLGHVIPDESGRPSTEATNAEKQFILDVFRYFVAPKAYPKWFSDRTKERFIDLYDIIEIAIFQENEYSNDLTVNEELNTIYYDCKSDPFIFEKKLQNLRKKGEKIGITTTDKVLCDRISRHLTGPFNILSVKYEMNHKTMKLTDLLDEIKTAYRRYILEDNNPGLDIKRSAAPRAAAPHSVQNSARPAGDHKPKSTSNTKPSNGKGKKKQSERLYHVQHDTNDLNSLRPL